MPTFRGALGRVRRRLRGAAVGAGPTSGSALAREQVDLVVGSTLFDDGWYTLCLGRDLDRRQAAEHYLAHAAELGLTPHPLFDPAFCAPDLAEKKGVPDDPLVTYLRDRRFDVDVHPLFDVERYVSDQPAALEHRDGPIGHYLEIGAPNGLVPNDWYAPDPAAEPGGLVDWIRADAQAWAGRQRVGLPVWGGGPVPEAAGDAPTGAASGLTTVVLVVGAATSDLAAPIHSLQRQTAGDWELVVVGVGHQVAPDRVPDDPRIRVAAEPQPTVSAARNHGLGVARGTHVAWMSAHSTWVPGRLASMRRALAEGGGRWGHDCAREDRVVRRPRWASRRATRAGMLAGVVPEIDTVLVERDLAVEVGGFDESLRGGQVLDFLLRLGERGEPAFVRRLGVVLDAAQRRQAAKKDPQDRPWVDFEELPSSDDVVLNRHLVDWDELAGRAVDQATVSVLVPTYQDWQMTALAVQRVVEHRTADVTVDVVVIDNGCGVVASAVLASLVRRHDGVTLVRSPVNLGFSLGNNIGLAEARGSTVVFLNNDTEVQAGWLAPLLESLRDDDVLGAQSLLLYPDGTVQSAGIVFPRGQGLPHPLLQGFPAEDAAGLEAESLHALTGAAVAMRFSDVVALRGFDPVFRNGMEDIDICLRLAAQRPGRFVVRPDSLVIHHESKTPGRFARSVANRRVLMDRWMGRLPEDDVAAWRRRGYVVVGHEIRSRVDRDNRLCVPEPVLTRAPRIEVTEGVPSLRWAIKHAAPYGPEGEKWGDTHFARHLADALRELGQTVVIDHRESIERSSGSLDEVVLLLRGLARHGPMADRVNLMWLISHPEDVEPSEHRGYDRVYVASVPFAREMAQRWGAPAVALLQATDPAVFHPDLAEPDTGHRVLFIGNSRGQARPLVVTAAEQGLDLSVYGSGWSGLIDDRFVRGTYLPNDLVGAAYRAAGVVLNDHWSDMHEYGFLSNRLFDAVAAGARVVTDDVAGVEEVFGDAVKVVRDPADLSRLVSVPDLDAVFGDDATRRERAAKVAAEHSFAARARTLVDDALAIRAERGLP
jgi:GT2 family glycosyltransferase